MKREHKELFRTMDYIYRFLTFFTRTELCISKYWDTNDDNDIIVLLNHTDP